MHLPDPVPIVIACPLLYPVLDRSMLPFDLLVSPPLIGVERSFAGRVVVDMGQSRVFLSVCLMTLSLA
jgi:hypothetical protein